jgi:hypothetical protein
MNRRATALLCAALVVLSVVGGATPAAADGNGEQTVGAASPPASTVNETLPFVCSHLDVIFQPRVNGTVDTANTTLELYTCDRYALRINETHVPNGTVTTQTVVENVGNATADTTLELRVNGVVRNTTRVRLDPGNETRVEMRTTFSEPGTYHANVSGVGPGRIDVWESYYYACVDHWSGFRPVPGGYREETCREDPDGDGLHEDVDADGDVGFEDAVELAFADHAAMNDDPDRRAAFDFDGDGDVDFDDAIELAFSDLSPLHRGG